MFIKGSSLLVFTTLTTSLFAVDGVTLINQASVQAAGGFPYVLNQPGSYRLSGNLIATNTTGLQIVASDVVLDLNGFSISSSACAGVPGISSNASDTSISNGSVNGFGGPVNMKPYGIYFAGSGGSADHVKVHSNGWGIFASSSLLVTNSVMTNNLAGIEADGTLMLSHSQVSSNSAVGILMTAGTLHGNVVDGNGTLPTTTISSYSAGIVAGSATIMNNIVTNNGLNPPANNGFAIFAQLPYAIVFGQNSFSGNRAISSAAALSLGNNACAANGGTGGLC